MQNWRDTGLFGSLAVSAKIKHLGLESVDIYGDVVNAGGLVGLTDEVCSQMRD